MEKNIAMYLRVSTEDQARNGYGLGDQEVRCKQYLDLYYPEDSNVVVYKDDGYSGGSLNRPAMKKMIEDLKGGRIKLIIVFKLDRLTRSVIDTYKLISMVTDFECSLIAVVDRLDINSANGRMLVGILSIIAQWEREVIGERVICAYTEKSRLGKYPFATAPIGWKKDDNGYLKKDEEKSGIINEMADLLIEGYSFSTIANIIKEKYNHYYKPDRVKYYLGRSENIGLWEYHGVAYNVFPPIMEKAKYKEVLNQLKYRTPHSLKKRNYLYYGVVYCQCGCRCRHVTTMKKSKTYYYYYCPECNKRISQGKLIDQTINAILLEHNEKKLQNKIKTIKTKYKRLQTDKEKIMDEYFEGKMDKKTFTFSVRKINDKQMEYEDKIKTLKIESYDEFLTVPVENQYEFIHSQIARIIVDLKAKVVIKIKNKRELDI